MSDEEWLRPKCTCGGNCHVEADTFRVASEQMVDAITLHHERVKTLGLNDHRGALQWGGPWDHELWATVGLPNGPREHSASAAEGTPITRTAEEAERG